MRRGIKTNSSNSSSYVSPLQGKIDDVLRAIPDNYCEKEFVTLPSVVAVLGAGDERDINTSKARLELYHQSVDRIVDEIIEEHHKGFNDLLSSCRPFEDKFDNTRNIVQRLRSDIADSKSMLQGRTKHLRQLWHQSIFFKEIVQLLDQVESFHKSTVQLDGYIQEKAYLQASRFFVDCMTSLEHCDKALTELDAVKDFRNDLVDRVKMLETLIIDELHKYIYLRGDLVLSEFRRFSRFGVPAFNGSSGPSTPSTSSTATPRSRRGDYDDNESETGSSYSNSNSTDGDRHSHHVLSARGHSPTSSDAGSVVLTAYGPVDEGDSNTEYSYSAAPSKGRSLLRLLEKMMDVQLPMAEDWREITEEWEQQHLKRKRGGRQYFLLLVEALDELQLLSNFRNIASQRILQELHATVETVVAHVSKQRVQAAAKKTDLGLGSPIASSGYKMPDKKETGILKRLIQGLFGVFFRILRNNIYVICAANSKSRQSTSPYTVRDIWNVMQHELKQVVSFAVGVSNEAEEISILDDFTSDGINFTFSDSVETKRRKTADVSRPSNMAEMSWMINLMKFVQPNPYHIPYIYNTVIALTDGVDNELELRFTDTPGQSSRELQHFMELALRETFLPVFKEEMLNAAKEATEGVESFRTKTVSNGSLHPNGSKSVPATPSTPVMHVEEAHPESMSRASLPAVATCETLLSNVFSFTSLLPADIYPELLMIAKHILRRLMERCQIRFQELVHGLFQPSRLEDSSYIQLLTKDPQYVNLCLGFRPDDGDLLRSNLAASALKEDQFAIEEQSRDEALVDYAIQIAREQLMFDQNRIQLLAHMHESLDWLGDRLFHIIKTFKTHSADLISEQEKGGGSSPSTPQLKGRANKKRPTPVHTKDDSPSPDTSSNISELITSLRMMREQCLALADRCLLALRLEMRGHCVHFLSYMKDLDYWRESEATDPEAFILQLNRDLVTVNEWLQPILPNPKLQFVWSGLERLVAAILIRSIRRVRGRRLNKPGVQLMVKNIKALQQNFTSLTSSKTSFRSGGKTNRPLDRVTQYYEYVLFSEENLCAVIKEKGTEFARQEWMSLVETRTPARPEGLSPEGRQIIDHLLAGSKSNPTPVQDGKQAGRRGKG